MAAINLPVHGIVTQPDPEAHDRSLRGRQTVSLGEFLDEVELVLAELGLP